jgi:hypothetical protein
MRQVQGVLCTGRVGGVVRGVDSGFSAAPLLDRHGRFVLHTSLIRPSGQARVKSDYTPLKIKFDRKNVTLAFGQKHMVSRRFSASERRLRLVPKNAQPALTLGF